MCRAADAPYALAGLVCKDMPIRDTNLFIKANAAVVLIGSDVLLALAMWGAAFMFQGVLTRFPLSAIAIGTVVPNVAIWVWMRAALGLYPGWGLDEAEERRRQTLALIATAAIIGVFASASQLGDSLPGPFLFAWAWGLLVTAPVVRPYVKAILYS